MDNKKLYIQMFSIHGLLRQDNLEMGRDADTGGQIKYVIELAMNLSRNARIDRIDLFTRLINDKAVSDDYSHPVSVINDKFRIIRIQCGGRKYIRKELLWPHLDEYVDKTVKFIKQEKRIPDVFHGHYADGGYVAEQLAGLFSVPFIFTGHSLGRAKQEKLLKDGLSLAEIDKRYKIQHRIHVEEDILKTADLIVTSTHQEIEQQYGMYRDNGFPPYTVIPPGLDVEKFHPYYHDNLSKNGTDEAERYARASVLEELDRFFLQRDKPLILTLCRPDKRKNITGLIQAFGEDMELQSMANLAIFAGIRKDISQMEENEKDVLTSMLLLMDKYDLYGKMAIPKKHDFELEVPALYRIAAEKRGVFVNPALTEPFGLTLIEAAASGLPIVATNDGGPKDTIANCKCGLLIDPTKPKEISHALKSIIADGKKWKQYSKNGILNVRKHYTWESHVREYMKKISPLRSETNMQGITVAVPSDAIGRRLVNLDYFIITDIDNTLIGDDNKHLQELCAILKENRQTIGFGVATGRTVESAVSHLQKHGVVTPDVIISSVGAELYYGKNLQPSNGWETHITRKWEREKIKTLLDGLPFLKYQSEQTQRKYKISYDMAPKKDRLTQIHDLLTKNKCRYNLIYSHDQFLDILPYRASKGKALRYLSYKWEIPLQNFLVCGDSGNDEEMLRGESLSVVVGNYSHELEPLRGGKNIYFAREKYAKGIIEALHYYQFIPKATGRMQT
ncbi:MAG: HAD-IIB family hydrolase [Desulfobacteraceae bacterium]|nr:MAG: HAD-IIB family hydrolase [Desulfobacteraceae bacterium]